MLSAMAIVDIVVVVEEEVWAGVGVKMGASEWEDEESEVGEEVRSRLLRRLTMFNWKEEEKARQCDEGYHVL